MIKHILSTVVATTICLTAFGQNVSVNPSNFTPRTVPSFHKTAMTVDANGNVSSNTDLGEKCFQHNFTETRMQYDPTYRQGVESAKEITHQIIREFDSGERAAPPVYTIPVVFHVIHKGEPVGTGTNISDAQIISSIDALNRDYRKTAANGGIGQGAGPDTEIQFCLAGVDPQGNPHSGITRNSGMGVSGYSSNGIIAPSQFDVGNDEAVKALNNWDNRYYLNVWIVSEINGNGADLSDPYNWTGGTLGYAYVPQGNVSWMSSYDGIVVVNICIGNDPNGSLGYRIWPFSRTNRTLTHEVGHYLGLHHVFDDNTPNICADGDGFTDTPNAKQVSSNNCNYPSACTNQMIENYMDYTNEGCQNRFTDNQKSYMRGVLTGIRSALVNTSNCGVATNLDAAVSAITTPSGSLCQTSFTPVVTLNNYGSTPLTSVQIQYYVDAQTPSTYNWSGSLASNSSTTVTLNTVTTTAGAHTFTARTVSGTLNGSNNDEVPSNDQATSSFSVNSGSNSVTLTLNMDCWGSETSWEIKNASNTTVASGGPYINNPNGDQFVQSFCLAQGCYNFNIFDSDNDGMSGSQYSNCSVNGNYTISDGSTTLVQMTAPNANFGSSATHNFCVGGGGTTTTCEELVSFDGREFSINPNDFPNFDIQVIDNDQQPVSTVLANAGYSSDWMAGFYESAAPGDTNWFIGITSWFANETTQADDWFIFGPATMLSDNGSITWKHFYSDANFRNGYEVLVNTTGTAISNFNGATVLYSVTDNDASTGGDTTWTQKSVTLPAGTYANQPLYFAFHHRSLNQYMLFLDDIVVEGCNSITVDISEKEQFNLNVYPNPSSHNFTFQYQSDSSDKLHFSMLNPLGQEVWNHQTNGGQNGIEVIETQGLSTGVYTLVVKGDKVNVSKRLILTQ